jgi:hypothetical protein
MACVDAFMSKYLEVVEQLVQKNPQNAELTCAVYDGALRCNEFGKAAKMAAKFVNTFKDASFQLPQVQLLYMDHLETNNAMSLNFATAFAEKYL